MAKVATELLAAALKNAPSDSDERHVHARRFIGDLHKNVSTRWLRRPDACHAPSGGKVASNGGSRLYVAALRAGNVEIAEALLSEGVDGSDAAQCFSENPRVFSHILPRIRDWTAKGPSTSARNIDIVLRELANYGSPELLVAQKHLPLTLMTPFENGLAIAMKAHHAEVTAFILEHTATRPAWYDTARWLEKELSLESWNVRAYSDVVYPWLLLPENCEYSSMRRLLRKPNTHMQLLFATFPGLLVYTLSNLSAVFDYINEFLDALTCVHPPSINDNILVRLFCAASHHPACLGMLCKVIPSLRYVNVSDVMRYHDNHIVAALLAYTNACAWDIVDCISGLPSVDVFELLVKHVPQHPVIRWYLTHTMALPDAHARVARAARAILNGLVTVPAWQTSVTVMQTAQHDAYPVGMTAVIAVVPSVLADFFDAADLRAVEAVWPGIRITIGQRLRIEPRVARLKDSFPWVRLIMNNRARYMHGMRGVFFS